MTIQKKKPAGSPYWWNPRGALVYTPDKKEPGVLKFTTRSCHLHIWRGNKRDTWEVRTLLNTKRGRVKVILHFTTEEFLSAFQLFRDLKKEKTEPDFAAEFESEFGIEGLYIRDGRRLNLPGPGTGRPGDTNFSIKLTFWVKKRIQDFVDEQSKT